MAKSELSLRIVSFGPFEFDLQTRELRKHGLRLKLQGQPLEVLAILVERSGEVVTREELQNRLWPVQTYVDFDHSLNAAVKRLRAALGDSAQSPRYIETLARRGYRLVAPLGRPIEAVLTTPGQNTEPVKRANRRPLMAAATATLVLTMVTGIRSILPNRPAAVSIRSLAVLPLANLSGDREQDYFVDGMTDALRQGLEGIRSLRVISRTSSVHYRDTKKALPDIARELNVDAVVDGSVFRSGNRLRINVELTQAALDKRLWSDSYDGDLRDVFGFQASVAAQIADRVRVTLTATDRARLARVRPVNPDAYQAYAKGRFFWNKRTPEDLERAITLFQQAVEKDPSYALAYDGLADCWLPLGWYGFRRPDATFPNARIAVTRALTLDDSLAEAHSTLAFIKLYYDRDWKGAEREFRRAIDLNPNYANGHHWFGEFLSLVGRHGEAIAESQRARELDPLSSIINSWVSSRYFFARQYDKAIDEGRNAVEMDPAFAPAHLVLGHAYEQKSLLTAAIREFDKAVTLGLRSSMYQASFAHALGLAGRRAEALRATEELSKMSEQAFLSSYDLAIANAGLRDKGKVLKLLDGAVKERSPRAAFLGVDPRFDWLRGDARFQDLLGSLGLESERFDCNPECGSEVVAFRASRSIYRLFRRAASRVCSGSICDTGM